jgi:hypothetical protein
MNKTTQELINEVKAFVRHESGKIISKRFTVSAFARNGKQHLVDFINAHTAWMAPEHDFAVRIRVVNEDVDHEAHCPTCKKLILCVSREYTNNNFWESYCDRDCKNTDPNLSNLMKERSAKVDQVEKMRKLRETNKKNTGYEYNSQRPEVKAIVAEKTINRSLSKENQDRSKNYDLLYDLHITKKIPVASIAVMWGLNYTTIVDWLNKHNIKYTPRINSAGGVSAKELRIRKEIESFYSGEVEYNNRSLLENKLEIDIFFPDKNIGIEFNGVHWHSVCETTKTTPNQHKEKIDIARSKGIDLMMLTEADTDYRFDIAINMIKLRIGILPVHTSNDFSIVNINEVNALEFFDKNHIEGFAKSNIDLYVSVQVENKIVFCASATLENDSLFITRMCSAIGVDASFYTNHVVDHILDLYDTVYFRINRMHGNTEKFIKDFGATFVEQTDVGYYMTDKQDIFDHSTYPSRTRTRSGRTKLSKYYDAAHDVVKFVV